jgi:hypothetical protein
METKNSHGLFKDLIKHIREEKEARMAFFYSIFYFVFITILLVFGFRAPAQTPAHFKYQAKVVKLSASPPGPGALMKKTITSVPAFGSSQK